MADYNPQQTLAVSILDREYRISCPDDAESDLIDAARLLDEKMREIRQAGSSSGKVLGTDRIAVIAALNIAHQLQETRRELHRTAEDIHKLDQRIDDILMRDMQLEL